MYSTFQHRNGGELKLWDRGNNPCDRGNNPWDRGNNPLVFGNNPLVYGNNSLDRENNKRCNLYLILFCILTNLFILLPLLQFIHNLNEIKIPYILKYLFAL